MLYDNAIQQALAQKQNVTVTVVKLATVTALDSSGRAKVTFFGENGESNKTYNYIEGYIPEVGDKVAMLPQGDTFIILGCIQNKNPKEASPYLTEQDGVSKLDNGTHSLALDGAELVPESAGAVSIGNASRPVNTIRTGSLYVNGVAVTGSTNKLTSGDNSLTLDAKTLKANWPGFQIGDASRPIALYSHSLTLTPSGASSPAARTFTPGDIKATALENTTSFNGSKLQLKFIDGNHLGPSNSTLCLGSSTYQFDSIYGKKIYLNGSAISTSDRRKKKDIKALSNKYVEFFKKLKPRRFRFKEDDGASHIGFIAQDVEQALHECDLNNDEFGGIHIHDGFYGLRYEEFIALQTRVIQDLMDRVEALERRAKDE